MDFDINRMAKEALVEILGEEGAETALKRMSEIEDVEESNQIEKLPTFYSGTESEASFYTTVSELVRSGKYQEAENVLDFIENKLFDTYLERYHATEKSNKNRAWICSILKNERGAQYYTALMRLSDAVCCLFYNNLDMWKYFSSKDFIDEFETEEYRKTASEFIKWLKPFVEEIKLLHQKEKNQIDEIYLDYDYEGRDLELFVRKNNARFNAIFDEIDTEIKRLFVLKE